MRKVEFLIIVESATAEQLAQIREYLSLKANEISNELNITCWLENSIDIS